MFGGADTALVSASLWNTKTNYEDLIAQRYNLNQIHLKHFATWASTFCESVKGQMTYLPGTLFHLWHGDRKDRQLETRYSDFKKYNFDPEKDLIDGEWAPHRTDLQRAAKEYFKKRKEDG